MNDPELILPLVALSACVLGLATSVGFGSVHAVRVGRQWGQDRAEHKYIAEVQEYAIAYNDVIDAVVELDRKVNHYRHNVHCPSCGRFARQAPEWPPGVALCGVHGIGLRTTPQTGAVAIVVSEAVLPPILALEPPTMYLTEPLVIPDDLSLLMEPEHS